MEGDAGIAGMAEEGNQTVRKIYDLIKNLPKYPKDESNWTCFIRKFRDLARFSGLSDSQHLKCVLYQVITGEAFLMVNAHDPGSALMAPLSYLEYEAHLASFFAPASESDLKKSEYLSKKQGRNEGMIAYLSTKYALFIESYPENQRSEADFCLEALSGMYSNDVKREVNRRSPISYKDLVEKASEVVAVARRAYLRGFGDAESLDGLATSTTMASKALINTASGETNMEINAVDGDRQCWWCGSYQHLKRECSMFLNNQPRVRPMGRGGFSRGSFTAANAGTTSRNREGGYRQTSRMDGNRGRQGDTDGNRGRQGDNRRRQQGYRNNRGGWNARQGVGSLEEAESTSADIPATEGEDEEGAEVTCLGNPGMDF